MRRPHFWPWMVSAGLLLAAVVALVPGPRRGPCDLIDWITPKAQAPVFDIGPLKSYWPDRLENVEIARLHHGRAGDAGLHEPLMTRIMVDPCMLIDWRALETMGVPESATAPTADADADKAGSGSDAGSGSGAGALRRVRSPGDPGTGPGGRRGMRIAVRTEIEGASCAEAQAGTPPPRAKGILVARALDPGQLRWRLFDALDRWLGRASRVDINTFIYRNSVLSPKHAFASANTRRYLIRDGAEILLVSFYVETDEQPGARTRCLLLAEMLKLTTLAARLRQQQAACRAPQGPAARQGVAL
ncbi:MAG: hypothetical protein AAF503_07330 [Pseudomonadota bacterium]